MFKNTLEYVIHYFLGKILSFTKKMPYLIVLLTSNFWAKENKFELYETYLMMSNYTCGDVSPYFLIPLQKKRKVYTSL